MFAYCGNNPGNSADPSGNIPFGILNLSDYAIIHILVEITCIIYYGWADEVYVKGENGKGFLDLLDTENNEYYEIKSLKSARRSRTAHQMEKYDNAIIQDTLGNRAKFPEVDIGEKVSRGTYPASGSFTYGIYDVEFWLYGPGLITYNATPNWDRALAIATAATIAALIVLFPEGAPAILPALMI